MATINITSQSGAVGNGDLQLQNGAPMDGTLRLVTDAVNTASPLKLSTALVQSTSTVKITTSDVAYIDAEDNSGNNRFTVSRASASQLVTVDFASVPTDLTTAVGAIRTATDGVNLANVMTFLENGKIGINEATPTAQLQVKGSGSTSATTSMLVQNSAGTDVVKVVDSLNSAIYSRTQFCLGYSALPNDNTSIRFLVLNTGYSYIDAYSEGTGKVNNYPLVIGSRVNNTGASLTGNTTAENGTPVIFGFEVAQASALVTINSTTRGFLPPRMTTVQKNAIATPAAGLMVYDSTLAKLCVYTTAWETITSV